MLWNADYSWILPGAQRETVASVLAALTLTAIVGCGDGGVATYPVSGKVIYPDGSPLASGVIELRSTAESTPVTARGIVHSDGTFELRTFREGDGAVAGIHQALVAALPKSDGDATPPAGGRYANFPIDPKFFRFETSGLTVNVSSEAENDVVLQVTRPAPHTRK